MQVLGSAVRPRRRKKSFFFSSRRRHTRLQGDWSSDVCSSDLTHNVGRAVELLHESEQRGPLTEILEESDAFPSALPVRREVDWAAWVTIQIGCDNTCAFCIVPSVRGREISRPLDEVVAEVEALAADGVVEVTLLGQNVNSYGRDLTRRGPLFASLLGAVGSVDGIRRVRYTSPHPKDLRP